MKFKITEIKMVESYMETLKVHPKRRVCIYQLTHYFQFHGDIKEASLTNASLCTKLCFMFKKPLKMAGVERY